MVRIQPAPARGRRWASEIEITGIEGKVANTISCSGRSSRPWSVVMNGVRLTGKQGKRIVVEMKVQQIEIMRPLENSLQHGDMQRIRVADRAVKTQCLRPTCLQVGRGSRIAAREQDNVMSERNQFVGQPRNNALGASIKLRRNGLSQRGYLCDLHAQSCLEIRLGLHATTAKPRFACRVGGTQCHLSNEVDSFDCAAQYDRRARADAQLRIDWKVRHSQLTPSCGSSSIHPHELCLSMSSAGRAIKTVVHLELPLEAEGCLIEERRVAVKASLSPSLNAAPCVLNCSALR